VYLIGRKTIAAGVLVAIASLGALAAFAGFGPWPATSSTDRPAGLQPAVRARMLPSPLYGVTVLDVSRLRQVAASLRRLPEMPTTRMYLDVQEPAAYYAKAVHALHPLSYMMGELLDSSDESHISTSAYHKRVRSYLAELGNEIDLWEIGNEVNGNWTGRYQLVKAKLVTAYNDVTAAGRRTALTLYYNVGCGDGPAELDPVAFSMAYVPRAVRDGLDYVLLSYYEDDCQGERPDARTWTAYFRKLHALYPHALLGFGEIGLNNPAITKTMGTAASLIYYYYGLAIKLPYYVGGYFWWYYEEDCLPPDSKPLWRYLAAGFRAEATTSGHRQWR
jgi:hypothetical protein